MSRSVRAGLREATFNAFKVAWGGLVAFSIYAILMAFGPGIEGRFFPVIEDYRLTNIREVQGTGYSFTPVFTKTRDCTYYGVTWFSQDETGNLTRVQLGRQQDPGPPITGPVGDRVGDRVVIFPPPGSRSIFGLNHHECGAFWQTRTMIGPFVIDAGELNATPTTARYAFNRH